MIHLSDQDGRIVGEEMHAFMRELYPICRSITGNGVRDTLRLIQKRIPLSIEEVPSGTQVFDWMVPKEWNIRDAYVRNFRGQKVIDFGSCNLHVMSYSVPVKQKMTLQDLKPHLFTLPDQPDLIPYRTSYYKENWGFCLSQNVLDTFEDGEYEVCIDASLTDGSMTYGEYFLPGASADEILLYTHVCHPSLCNDNLSGIVLAAQIAEHLRHRRLRYSYRFLFCPGTIGSVTWLALNESRVGNIKHGLVLANIGDAGHTTYKKSRLGSAEIDRSVMHVLKHSGANFEIEEFSPYGYDERQFCSPGFNLPVGCLMRTPHGRFPQYHTSADDPSFVQSQFLEDSFRKCLQICEVLENNQRYLNQNPKCEPRLGKRGLYRPVGGQTEAKHEELALLWVLNLSDGQHALLDIAERSGLSFAAVATAAAALAEHGLLKPLDSASGCGGAASAVQIH
jgi:aminopeptidase-like protein